MLSSLKINPGMDVSLEEEKTSDKFSSGSNITEGVFESEGAIPAERLLSMALSPIDEDVELLSHSLRGGIEIDSEFASSELLIEVEEDLSSEFDS